MLAIALGDTAEKEYAMAALSLAGGIMGVIGTLRTMDDLGSLIKDLDDEMRETHYGSKLVKAPIPVLKAIIVIIYFLVVGTQVFYLFS